MSFLLFVAITLLTPGASAADPVPPELLAQAQSGRRLIEQDLQAYLLAIRLADADDRAVLRVQLGFILHHLQRQLSYLHSPDVGSDVEMACVLYQALPANVRDVTGSVGGDDPYGLCRGLKPHMDHEIPLGPLHPKLREARSWLL